MRFEPLRLPFKVTEFGEDMVLAINRNFAAIEQSMTRVQVYQNNYGIPSVIDWINGTSIRNIIAEYGDKKVFKQQDAPPIGMGPDEAREFDLWLSYDEGTPVWRQLRKFDVGLQWVVVADRTTHPAEYDIITTVGLDAAVITTGLLDAALIQVGANTVFEPGYDPSKAVKVFLDEEPEPPYGEGDLWIPPGQNKILVCIQARDEEEEFNEEDWEEKEFGDYTQTVIDQGIITTGRIELKGGDGVTKAGITGGGTGDLQVRLWAGQTYANRFSAPFRVTQGGEITATAGYIGGWMLDGTSGLKLGIGTNTRGISTGSIAFYAGDTNPAAAPFRVSTAGQLIANTGTLKGLVIGDPTTAGLYVDSTRLGYYDGGMWRSFLDSSGKFYLGGTSGSLQWNGSTLTITGNGTFTGHITANSGHIGGVGGWIIASRRLYSNDIELREGVGTFGYIRNTANRWRLNNDGSGSLASGMISWTSGGVVTFSGGHLGGINRVTLDGSGLNVGSLGSIRGGASSFTSGAGFWMGYYGGAYVFRCGSPGSQYLSWNGVSLTIRGHLDAATGTFSGSLSAATGTFSGSLSAVGGTFTGSLSASTGTFSWLRAGTSSNGMYLTSDGVYGYSGGSERIRLTRTQLLFDGGSSSIYTSNLFMYIVSNNFASIGSGSQRVSCWSGGNKVTVDGGSGNIELTSSTSTFNTTPTFNRRANFHGTVYGVGIRDNTTSLSPNVHCSTSTGWLRTSTSAKKYKRDIEPLEYKYAEKFLLNCEPIWFRSRCDGDNQAHSFYGYCAEDVMETEPRLVQYDDKDEPQGFSYDRVTALLHVILKDHHERIEALERRVESG